MEDTTQEIASAGANVDLVRVNAGNQTDTSRLAELEAGRDEYRKLMDVALEAYRDEYKEIADEWRSIETKAQGSVAVAGIFAAAVFAFARDLANSGTRVQKVLAVCTLSFLICSVLLSILVLYVRRIAAPPLGETVDKKVRQLMKASVPDEEIAGRLHNLKSDQAELWRRVNAEASTANETKGKWLLRAQLCLILAIITVGVLTVLILFT